MKEPYKPVGNGSFSGAAVRQSPDPLIRYRWPHPALSDSLQIYTLSPAVIKVSDPSSFVIPFLSGIDGVGIAVTGKGDLLFDFGVESAGWLEFESDDLTDTVEMSISEYNEPAIVNDGAQHPVKTRTPVKYGNTYRLELNDQLYEGVRFGWIHVRHFTRPWHIKKVRLVCQVRPTNYNGSFWCNDTLLTRIWYTGAYTVKLNLLKDYFGAILMERSDRQSWTGDAYPSQAAALVAFGNYDMIKANLSFTSTLQDNGIPAYSLYWVLSLVDYFSCTGDTLFFNRLTANASRRLDAAYRRYDSLPGLGFMGWDERLGAGFENPDTKESRDTYAMLCIKTWSRFAKAARLSGNRDLADKYETYAAAKAGLVQDTVLAGLGIHALSEAIDGGMLTAQSGEQQPLTGQASPRTLPLPAANSSHASALFSDPNERLSYSPFNQYFIIQAMATAGYYPEALAAIKDCWGGQIRYGGTTFFEVYRPSWNEILGPNDAPPNNQCGYTSLAHPWGAGVTSWLSEEVLGIKPVTPGFRTFTILPHPGDAITIVKGTMPTPHGPIKASFNMVSGDCSVTVPPGTLATRVGLPKAGREITTLYVNGRLVYTGPASSLRSPKPDHAREPGLLKYGQTSRDDSYVYLNGLQPGTYHIKINYGAKINFGSKINYGAKINYGSKVNYGAKINYGSKVNYGAKINYGSKINSVAKTASPVQKGSGVPSDPASARQYPEKRQYAEKWQSPETYGHKVGHFTQDSTTSGHWKGKYGQDGYVLFGYKEKDSVRKLPAYIQSVIADRKDLVVWDSVGPDARAVGPEASAAGIVIRPIAAAIITRDPNATLQTMIIDIVAKDTLAHTLSLYFLDYDRKERRSAIELFNPDNFSLIAPVQLVQRYEEGKYISFSCKGSVRIRIDQVRGMNAAVSGIFFD